MLTIQRNYWRDHKAADAKGISVPFDRTNPLPLYKAIATYLGVVTEGMSLKEVQAAIVERNLELACV